MKNFQVFICPSAVPYSKIGSNPAYVEVTTAGGGNTSYAANGILGDRNMAVINDSAGIVLIREFRFYHRTAQTRPYLNGGNYTQFQTGNMENSHFDGANRLFADGHAKWSKKTNMTFADYGAGGATATDAFAESGTTLSTQQSASLPAAF